MRLEARIAASTIAALAVTLLALVTVATAPADTPAITCALFGEGDHIEVGHSDNIAICHHSDDNDSRPVTISADPAQHGTLDYPSGANGPAPTLLYTATEVGDETISFHASDGAGQVSEQYEVHVHNVPATAHAPQCSGEADSPHAVELGTTAEFGCFDFDPGSTLAITIVHQPSKGTLQLKHDGTGNPSVVYTGSSLGSDSFTYKASDGALDSPEQTVGLTNVPRANHRPDCSVRHIDLDVGDSWDTPCFDFDGDAEHISVVSPPSRGTVSILDNDTSSARVRYTATSAGSDAYSINASDGQLESAAQTMTFTNTGGTRAASLDTPELALRSPGKALAVASSGSVTLPRTSVDCTGSGPDCSVSTDVVTQSSVSNSSAGATRAVSLGRSRFRVKTGRRGSVKLKLSRNGLRSLRRRHRLRTTARVVVRRGGTVVRKTVPVTLRAPR